MKLLSVGDMKLTVDVESAVVCSLVLVVCGDVSVEFVGEVGSLDMLVPD